VRTRLTNAPTEEEVEMWRRWSEVCFAQKTRKDPSARADWVNTSHTRIQHPCLTEFIERVDANQWTRMQNSMQVTAQGTNNHEKEFLPTTRIQARRVLCMSKHHNPCPPKTPTDLISLIVQLGDAVGVGDATRAQTDSESQLAVLCGTILVTCLRTRQTTDRQTNKPLIVVGA